MLYFYLFTCNLIIFALCAYTVHGLKVYRPNEENIRRSVGDLCGLSAWKLKTQQPIICDWHKQEKLHLSALSRLGDTLYLEINKKGIYLVCSTTLTCLTHRKIFFQVLSYINWSYFWKGVIVKKIGIFVSNLHMIKLNPCYTFENHLMHKHCTHFCYFVNHSSSPRLWSSITTSTKRPQNVLFWQRSHMNKSTNEWQLEFIVCLLWCCKFIIKYTIFQ